MIRDTIHYLGKYRALGKRFATAIDYLVQTDLQQLEPGRHTIDGDDVFILVSEYTTKPLESGFWEAHRKYVDFQFIISGKEQIGYANLNHLTVSKPYEESSDALFLDGPADDMLIMNAGELAIFWPEDAHMPSIADGTPSQVKKAVVKVKL